MLGLSARLKLKIWGWSVQSSLKYSSFNILRLYSIGVCLLFKHFTWVTSLQLKFKIWTRSNEWLLRYSTFTVWGCLPFEVIFHWRLPSIGGYLHFKNFQFWFGPRSLSLNFEEDLIGGYWDIPLLIFWSRLPLGSSSLWVIFNIGLVPLAKV